MKKITTITVIIILIASLSLILSLNLLESKDDLSSDQVNYTDSNLQADNNIDPEIFDSKYHNILASTEDDSFFSENPANNSIDIHLRPRLTIRVYEKKILSCTFYLSDDNTKWTHYDEVDMEGFEEGTLLILRDTEADEFDKTYYWKVSVDTIQETLISDVYQFTTLAKPDPVIDDVHPADKSENVKITQDKLSVSISDAIQSHSYFNWSIETIPNIGSSMGIKETEGEKTCSISELRPNKEYTWYVNVTDGIHCTNKTYVFTTESRISATNFNPFDGKYGVSTDLNEVSVNISSSNDFSYTIEGDFITNKQENNVETGIYTAPITTLLQNKKYTWYVNITSCVDPHDTLSYSSTFYTYELEKYDIALITTEEYYDKAVEFKDWKEGKTSFKVKILKVSEIEDDKEFYVNGTWGDNNPCNKYYMKQELTPSKYNDSACKVRNFIRYVVSSHNVNYVILFGRDVPVRHMKSAPYDMLWYGCLNGTQNINNSQNSWGFGDNSDEDFLTDWIYDVTIGRFPFKNIQECNNMINKTKNYHDISPNDIQSKTMALYCGLFFDADYDYIWTSTSYGYKYTYLGDLYNKGVLTFVNGTGIAPGQVGPFENCITEEQVDNDLNNIISCKNETHPHGIILYAYMDHDDLGFARDTTVEDFTNASHPFILLSEGCSQGNFEKDYFKTQLSLRAKGGSVVLVGASVVWCPYNTKSFINEIYKYNRTLGSAFSDYWQSAVLHCHGYFKQKRGSLGYYGDPTLRFKYQEKRGDINCDGSVGAADITYVQEIMFGNLNEIPPADLNQDGEFNIEDIQTIEQIFLGYTPD